MPHHHHTKSVRKSERTQITHQEKELAALANELNREAAESPAVPSIDGAKEHRRARLEQKRQHKPERFRAALANGS